MSRIIEFEISCCGECLYYDINKHECRKGAKDEGAPNDRFYKNCPLKWREITDEYKGGKNET